MMGFEPTTSDVEGLHSTIELHPLFEVDYPPLLRDENGLSPDKHYMNNQHA